MAVFDKASLVMIPSQYKEGKIYNIKPEDQSSSFEFERGSAATRVNSSGLIEYVGIGAELASNNTILNAGGGVATIDGLSVSALSDGTASSTIRPRIDFNDLVVGETYLITFSNITTTGTIGFSLYNGSSYEFNQQSEIPSQYVFTKNSGSDAFIAFNGNVVFTANFDISLKQISNDTPRLDYSGTEPALLLEPQRTNEYLNSNDFSLWNTDASVTSTANQLASPDGNINATLMSVTNSGRIYYDPTISTTADRVLSIFIKGGTFNHFRVGLIGSVALVDLINETSSIGDINSIGNGWYRVSLPPTSVSSTSRRAQIQSYPDNTYTNSHGQSGTYYIYGAQLEQGSYATSYIPTNGQTETRLADVCGTGGYDSVFNNSQGTLYMEFKSPTEGNSSAWINLSSGTDTDDWLFFGKDQDKLRVYLKQNNVVETSDTSTNLPTDFAKVAVTYNTNSFKLNVNGVEVFDKNISPNFANNLDTLSFGSTTSTPLPEKIEVKALHYFPEALTDTELQQLTTI